MNKSLPMLYARGNNGKVLEWTIEVSGNKHRAVHGAQGFLHVTDEWTVAEAKNVGRANATKPDEQAYLEALAKWSKKLKSGGYWKNIKDIDNFKFVEPMLAWPLVDSKHDRTDRVEFPCMVDRKYNGGRVIITRHGAFTRKGEKYGVIPHLIEVLQPLFKEHPNLVIDGEGYNHQLRYHLNETMKIMRTTVNITEELLKRSKQIIRLYVYDGYGFDYITEESRCYDRRKGLKELLKGVEYVTVVPFKMAANLAEIYSIYQEFVEEGYEGAIIRNSDAPYQHKRTNDLLKVKPEDDDEATIIKINEGVGGASGLAATATVRMADGREFDATIKAEAEKKVEILREQKSWIGREVTFLYNGLTGKKIPNFARIDVNNCFKK